MDDPKLYEKVNNMPRKDVKEILEQNPIKWKKENARVLDIGCGDGSVTMEILMKNMPDNFDKLLGCDISEKSIKYAQECYGSEKVQFMKLDIQGKVPDELKGSFDHILSSYAFHWVMEQETAFTNVYNMLAEGGNCLIIFLGRNSVYEVYDELSSQPKWKEDLKHVRTKFISPYHDSLDAAAELQCMMKSIGFKDVDVRAPEKTFCFGSGVNEFRQLMKSINPFDSLNAKWEDFMDDFVKLDPDAETTRYRLIIAYGSK